MLAVVELKLLVKIRSSEVYSSIKDQCHWLNWVSVVLVKRNKNFATCAQYWFDFSHTPLQFSARPTRKHQPQDAEQCRRSVGGSNYEDVAAARRGRFRVTSSTPQGPPETTLGRFRLMPTCKLIWYFFAFTFWVYIKYTTLIITVMLIVIDIFGSNSR